MITPTERLLINLVTFAINDPDAHPDTIRRELSRFADAYALDLQDTATLFRVASGENVAGAVPAMSPGFIAIRPGDRLTVLERERAVNIMAHVTSGPTAKAALDALVQAGYTIVPPVKS